MYNSPYYSQRAYSDNTESER